MRVRRYGVLNGSETGTDCGGPDCGSCSGVRWQNSGGVVESYTTRGAGLDRVGSVEGWTRVGPGGAIVVVPAPPATR